MQDIHAIGGRLYGGGGGGDRRLRPHHHHQGHAGQSPKCPRCDSANTKFCYYNNYNLSQPRHFCKACRRYWTKGGVLRNVPVGGGCRKTKRNPSSSSSAKSRPPSQGRKKSGNSQSSSDSSSLTASTATVATEVASSVVAAPPRILDFSQADPMTSSSDPPDGCGIFSTAAVGGFTSMMTSSSDPLMELNFGGGVVEDQSLSHQQWSHRQGIVIQEAAAAMPEELKMQEITGGFLDQTCQMDMSGRHQSGLGTLDQELFDLTGAVDQGYWTSPQWTDTDHALYLP